MKPEARTSFHFLYRKKPALCVDDLGPLAMNGADARLVEFNPKEAVFTVRREIALWVKKAFEDMGLPFYVRDPHLKEVESDSRQ